MAWDSSRPIPWMRLVRDWLLYMGVMLVIFTVVFRDRISAGTVAGLFASGPLFVALGAVLAKFGYTRKTMKDLRAETERKTAARGQQPVAAVGASRTRPAPTKRTSGGPSNRPTSKRKR